MGLLSFVVVLLLYILYFHSKQLWSCREGQLTKPHYSWVGIHVIFSSSQIGRFGISQREIGVSDREIFAR